MPCDEMRWCVVLCGGMGWDEMKCVGVGWGVMGCGVVWCGVAFILFFSALSHALPSNIIQPVLRSSLNYVNISCCVCVCVCRR